ncbi:hypothetical protein JTE90_029382 [Oedothorax gibbosus]|uniref:RRM domain-containing protein n=1 Tax=Oedothorax gibbosus TaxID=931172 RepID=A0AAV6VQI5_9ARAC|nr:hypothetical protein JTE90_029382 [Oedothorax gibbosus]
MENDQDNSGGSASKVMRMEENVNESQMAAAFSEGWGQRGINQDTAWEVPSSPHLSPTKDTSATWSNSNNASSGTEIWENNVRHPLKGPATKMPQQVREPWGSHTPTTHIGGTWGEEEDTTNLWTGVPPQASGGNYGPPDGSVYNPGAEKPGWDGSNIGNPGMAQNWNEWNPALQIDLRRMPLTNENKNIAAMQIGLPHMVPMPNENKNIAMDDSGPENAPPWADPKQQNRNFSTWSPGNKKMNPSGWEETAPPPIPGQSGPNYDDGTANWGNPVMQGKVSHWKEMPPANKQMPPNCVMPPNSMPPHGGMIRLPQSGPNKPGNMYDPSKADPASWMKTQPPVGRTMSWNEVQNAPGRRMWDDVPQMPDKGVPGAPNMPNSAFGGNSNETGYPVGPYLAAKKNSNTWADGQVDTSSWGGPMKQGGKPLTKDLIWASKQFRLLMEMNFKKDDIENALRRSNMGLEEALMELHALNNKENSMIDIEGLTAMNLNQPRMHLGNVAEDMNFSEHAIDSSMPPGNLYGGSAFPGMNMFSTGFNVAQNLKNQNSVGNNIAPNILGNAGTNTQVPNFNLNNGINNLSPAMMRKLLTQAPQTFNPALIPQNTGRMAQQNFPSTAQLRILVQQIQMAVQAGHLNPTILNQPLAPQTLQLLYQLLQQIRFLHQLQQQQIFLSQHGSKPGSPPLQINVQITQAKQHIANLQNQIASQQAIFLKQQVQLPVQHPSLQTPQPSTFDVNMKTNLETINGLHSEFRDLSVKEPSSRLNQWKLCPFDKDENIQLPNGNNPRNNVDPASANDFSRAPGPIAKSSSGNNLAANNPPTHANMQTLNEHSWSDMVQRPQSDQPWSSDSGDPMQEGDSGSSDNGSKPNSASSDKDSNCESSSPTANPSTPCSTTSSQPGNAYGPGQQSYNLNDLVPEFEPGKPWKGSSRINKNFEDDPHVTPGSIAKSPLSLNSIKDSELFAWKQGVTSSPLTSSTWTFSPPPSSQNSDSSSGRSGNSRSWNNRPNEQDRMPWKGSAPMPKTSRPPPGMSGQNKPITSNWMGNEGSQQWSANAGWDKQPGSSNFLVLKNLTPQIDGSTLKTLCLQHGPLQLFHLLLNHGIALVRYNSREETDKARSALNNCVLSNTTILVDIPTEGEVKAYLQLANGSSNSASSASGATTWSSGEPGFNGGSSSGKLGTANWNSTSLNLQSSSSDVWSFSSGSGGNGLWPMQTTPTDHDPCIASPLNSFLPGDLLGGGESI